MEDEKTTIWISKTTKARLDSFGNFKDSYDDILIKILDFFELKRVDELLKEKSRNSDVLAGETNEKV